MKRGDGNHVSPELDSGAEVGVLFCYVGSCSR